MKVDTKRQNNYAESVWPTFTGMTHVNDNTHPQQDDSCPGCEVIAWCIDRLWFVIFIAVGVYLFS